MKGAAGLVAEASGPVVCVPQRLALGTARLFATGKAGSAAGRAVEVVGYVGLVFWQAHGAGAGCHEVSQKQSPASAGLGVVDRFAPSVALVAAVAGSLAHPCYAPSLAAAFMNTSQ